MRATSKAGRPGSRAAMAVVVCVVAAGCSGGKPAPEATADLRVPECEEYGRRMAACFDRSELANLMPTVARDEADRAHMGQMCSQSMSRLTIACR
jgi:hypothetical protein